MLSEAAGKQCSECGLKLPVGDDNDDDDDDDDDDY